MGFDEKFDKLRQADYGHCKYIWEEAQKEVIFDDFHFLIGAIINRVRFLEKRIYSEDTYFKIASRKELFYWLDFRDKHNLGFSFAKETEEFFNSNR